MADATAITSCQLREYTRNAMRLEGGIYYFQQMQSDVQDKIQSLQQQHAQISDSIQSLPQQPVKPHWEDFEPERKVKTGWMIGAIISALLVMNISYTAIIPGLIVGFIVYFVGTTLFDSDKKMEKYARTNYTAAMNVYNIEMQNYPTKLKMYNEACRKRENMAADIVKAINDLIVVKNELSQKIANAKLRREEFYSANIIHPKYQGLVSMSRFFEYFDTGMCDTLKEAMNVFETELRFERIKGSIDQLTSAVDGVQSTLFETKIEINAGIDRISSLFEIADGKLDVQNYYNQITAECNKQIASDMNALKFYRKIEWIQDRGILPLV